MTNEIKTWLERLNISKDVPLEFLTNTEQTMLEEITELRAKVESLAADAERKQNLSDDALYAFWLRRDCMDAIRAGDMRGQFISAARAAIAAAAPNAVLVEALRNFTDGCSVSVDAFAVARAALASAGVPLKGE